MSKKKFKVRPGTKLYLARHWSNVIETIKVVRLTGHGKLIYTNNDGRLCSQFLQDLGMPGWRYDNRPVQLHRKLSAAYRNHPRAIRWFREEFLPANYYY